LEKQLGTLSLQRTTPCQAQEMNWKEYHMQAAIRQYLSWYKTREPELAEL
jgi:hypothetical protein